MFNSGACSWLSLANPCLNTWEDFASAVVAGGGVGFGVGVDIGKHCCCSVQVGSDEKGCYHSHQMIRLTPLQTVDLYQEPLQNSACLVVVPLVMGLQH